MTPVLFFYAQKQGGVVLPEIRPENGPNTAQIRHKRGIRQKAGENVGVKDKDGLTPAMSSFCEALVASDDVCGAYRAAYNAGRMKEATVRRKAYELLQNPKVAARMEKLKEKVRKTSEAAAVMSRVEVLQELTRIAGGTGVYPVYGTDGEELVPRPASLSQRLKALELLGKHHQIFTESVKIGTEKPFEVNITVLDK